MCWHEIARGEGMRETAMVLSVPKFEPVAPKFLRFHLHRQCRDYGHLAERKLCLCLHGHQECGRSVTVSHDLQLRIKFWTRQWILPSALQQHIRKSKSCTWLSDPEKASPPAFCWYEMEKISGIYLPLALSKSKNCEIKAIIPTKHRTHYKIHFTYWFVIAWCTWRVQFIPSNIEIANSISIYMVHWIHERSGHSCYCLKAPTQFQTVHFSIILMIWYIWDLLGKGLLGKEGQLLFTFYVSWEMVKFSWIACDFWQGRLIWNQLSWSHSTLRRIVSNLSFK